MDLPPVELVCPRCHGKGKIINPDAHDIHYYTEWLCGIQDAVRKERAIWHPELTARQTREESMDWLFPHEAWNWAATNRYYVG